MSATTVTNISTTHESTRPFQLALGDVSLNVTLERITPDVAKEYLSSNERNRTLSESQMAKIRDALNEGDWCVNGATIVFDWNGVLSDGQHRLMGIIRTGKSIVTLVVRGVEPFVAQDTTDNTRKRTLSSQLQMRGEANYKSLASAINVYWQLCYSKTLTTSSGGYPSITQGLRVLEDHPGLRGSVVVGNRTKDRPLRFSSGIAAGLHYAFSEVSPDDADAFWARFVDGSGLQVGDPIHTLRERMIADAARTPGKQGMSQKYRTAITIKAWNAWLKGEELRLLKWRPGGANPEAFPAIAGYDDAEASA